MCEHKEKDSCVAVAISVSRISGNGTWETKITVEVGRVGRKGDEKQERRMRGRGKEGRVARRGVREGRADCCNRKQTMCDQKQTPFIPQCFLRNLCTAQSK
jgi:hypothetical protein